MDGGDALITILAAPFVGLAFGIVFYAVGVLLGQLEAVSDASGPLSGSFDAVQDGFSGAVALFQLASDIEFLIAIVILAISIAAWLGILSTGR